MNNNKDFLARFNFHSMPFTREISVKDRFILDVYDQHLEHLYRAVNKRMSAALIAPSGTGKTMLLRTLVDRLPETRYRVHYVKVTSLSKRDLCREISAVADIEKAGNYPTLVRRLQECFAASLDVDSLRPVLILDEAHNMRVDVFSILSILTNFNMDSRLVVSIILAGQLELSKLLRREQLEETTRRMTHCATLRLLSAGELTQYVKHRCSIAGNASYPFDSDALAALYEITRGNLRATDYLSLKALEAAHDNNDENVNANHVTQARGLLWP